MDKHEEILSKYTTIKTPEGIMYATVITKENALKAMQEVEDSCPRWVKPQEKLPPMEKELILKHESGKISKGNFFERDSCYYIFFQKTGTHEEYEIPYYIGTKIEYLLEPTKTT